MYHYTIMCITEIQQTNHNKIAAFKISFVLYISELIFKNVKLLQCMQKLHTVSEKNQLAN